MRESGGACSSAGPRRSSVAFRGDDGPSGRVPLRTAPPGGERGSARGLDLSLPCLPTSDGKRLRDAGRVSPGRSTGGRSLQRLHANLGRGGQEGACLPLLPRLRVAGLLYGTGRAGLRRRLRRLVRRPFVP